ncbi:hypothetical protein [Methylocaldum sp.]|uniref:hypothetical protein n=1 Tax=Methylocaldum sp. TaxID=1969727 RepID=UPI002D22600F|nr:hypothetical protein [Methylocaldum sp.]HYE38147.1 hypothetical protein [Methylocaldum sp.]
MEEENKSSLREQKELWASLLAHEGWKILSGIIQEQVENRKDLIFSPLERADEAFKQEYLKGEAAFGELVLALPTTMLEQVQVDLDRLKESNSDKGDLNV